MIFAFILNAKNGRRVWSFTDNDWVLTDRHGNKKFWYAGFIGMIASSLGNVVGTYFVALTFQTSISAGVNQGVMSTLFVLSAVFSAIFAYLLLNEKMNVSQYVGFVLLIGCAILLSLSQASENIVDIAYQNRISPIWPVLAGVGSSLGFGIRSVIM